MQKIEQLISDSEETVQRIRWSKKGKPAEPVVVFFAGIHGNEPAGLQAVDRVAKIIEREEIELEGSVYAVTGNIEALRLGVRFLDIDLNRMWESFGMNPLGGEYSSNGNHSLSSEQRESLEIRVAIESILNEHGRKRSDFIFTDLHTTSSQSCAFILLNDTLANRELARKFPVPQILGIEENIHGTLLSYINNLGYKAIGFEAGAHTDEASIDRSEAFFWLLLYYNRMIDLPGQKVTEYENRIRSGQGIPDSYYEILYHKPVENPEKFQMITGFQNFDPIEKDEPLAYEYDQLLRAPASGRIFMPLYQKVGQDGYLIIHEVSAFWLELSGYLRRSFVHSLLRFMPGVSVVDDQSYQVDINVARFFVKEIFHLLGYRVLKKDQNTLICYKR